MDHTNVYRHLRPGDESDVLQYVVLVVKCVNTHYFLNSLSEGCTSKLA